MSSVKELNYEDFSYYMSVADYISCNENDSPNFKYDGTYYKLSPTTLFKKNPSKSFEEGMEESESDDDDDDDDVMDEDF